MNLKEARTLLGFTQQQLANKSDMHLRLYQKYEKGECSFDNMTTASKNKLENALGITLEEMEKVDLSMFKKGLAKSIQAKALTLKEVVLIDKLAKVKELSQIGKFDEEFEKHAGRIPERLFLKLPAEDLAELTDCFFECYYEKK